MTQDEIDFHLALIRLKHAGTARATLDDVLTSYDVTREELARIELDREMAEEGMAAGYETLPERYERA